MTSYIQVSQTTTPHSAALVQYMDRTRRLMDDGRHMVETYNQIRDGNDWAALADAFGLPDSDPDRETKAETVYALFASMVTQIAGNPGGSGNFTQQGVSRIGQAGGRHD